MRFSEDRIEKLTCSDGIRRDIHIWEHEAPKAVFLTLHGLMDHGGNYMNPGVYMKKQGYALVAHDQQGHDMKRLTHVPRFDVFLDDLELMLAWVKEHYPGVPIFMMGHSMGGLILTHFGIRVYKEDPLVKGFVLSAPGYENSLKTSKFLIAMARLLSKIAPEKAVPVEDLRPHVTRDTIEFILADQTGRWLGKGWGNLKENDILLKSNLTFPLSGDYSFLVQHAMRKDTLHGISNIGLRIEKSN